MGAFEAVFAAMVNPKERKVSADVQRATRLAFLSEWRTTQECAVQWETSRYIAREQLVRFHAKELLEYRKQGGPKPTKWKRRS